MRIVVMSANLNIVWLLWLVRCLAYVVAAANVIANDIESCSKLLREVELVGRDGMNEEMLVDLQGAITSLDFGPASLCVDRANELLSGRHGMSLVLARAYEALAIHPACIKELMTKSHFETRCTQKFYKVAIQILLGGGEKRAASETFGRAVDLRASSHPSSRILWPSVVNTPTIWIPGLRSAPTWDCNLWPFTRALEANSHEIRDEVLALTGRGSFTEAYPYLSQSGSWENLFLFQDRTWNKELCALMPTTCRLLSPELPTKPGVPFTTSNNEEVVIFRSKKGASVGLHCGASNNQINLHITLAGDSTTILQVGDEELSLREGRTICFQDSYAHSVEHYGDAERISLVVRVMHPQMDADFYGNATRTDSAILGDWDPVSSLTKEVARLREEYRRLARSSLQFSNTSCTCGGEEVTACTRDGQEAN